MVHDGTAGQAAAIVGLCTNDGKTNRRPHDRKAEPTVVCTKPCRESFDSTFHSTSICIQ